MNDRDRARLAAILSELKGHLSPPDRAFVERVLGPHGPMWPYELPVHIPSVAREEWPQKED